MRPQLHDFRTADLFFDIGGREIACHRAVLSDRCAYLREHLSTQPSSRVYVKNAPYDATELALRHLYEPEIPLDVLVPAAQTWDAIMKIWEVGLRFGLGDLSARCTELLSSRITTDTVCQLLVAASRYPKAGDGPGGCNAMLRQQCLQYVSDNHQELSRTPQFSDMMKSSRLRREIDGCLKGRRRRRTRTSVPTVSADLSGADQRTRSVSSMRPHPTATTPSQGDDVFAPVTTDKWQRDASAASDGADNMPTFPRQSRQTPPPPRVSSDRGVSALSSPRSVDASGLPDVEEPVYESIPIFHTEFAAGDRTPAAPSGGGAAERYVRLAVCQHAGCPPPQHGWRLATLHEAQAQEEELIALMEELDFAHLGSYALADGKVDGPGFGVPLRFSGGDFERHCGFRVEAKNESAPKGDAVVTQPPPRSVDQSASPSCASAVHQTTALERVYGATALGEESTVVAAEHSAAQDSIAEAAVNDSLRLQCCGLQQDLTLTRHELEVFKSDWFDWEEKVKEAARLKEEEEARLRKGIAEQHEQILSVAAELRGGDRSTHPGLRLEDTKARDAEAERIATETAQIEQSNAAVTAELAKLDQNMAEIEAECAKLTQERSLIQTELRDNEQYEEYSKQYVCAVRAAELEIREGVLNASHAPTAQQIEQMSAGFLKERQVDEASAQQLEATSRELKSRLDREVRQIQRIRAFLDQTEGGGAASGRLPVP